MTWVIIIGACVVVAAATGLLMENAEDSLGALAFWLGLLIVISVATIAASLQYRGDAELTALRCQYEVTPDTLAFLRERPECVDVLLRGEER